MIISTNKILISTLYGELLNWIHLVKLLKGNGAATKFNYKRVHQCNLGIVYEPDQHGQKFVHNLRPNTTKNHTLHASKAFKMEHSSLNVIKLLQYEMARKSQV